MRLRRTDERVGEGQRALGRHVRLADVRKKSDPRPEGAQEEVSQAACLCAGQRMKRLRRGRRTLGGEASFLVDEAGDRQKAAQPAPRARRGRGPIRRGEPGFSAKLDRDGDRIACEPYRAAEAAASIEKGGGALDNRAPRSHEVQIFGSLRKKNDEVL